jgi:LCP family protein required for cell wall assembly
VSGVAAVLGFGLVYANTVIGQVDDALTTADNWGLVSNPPPPTGSAAPADTNAGSALNILLMGSDARNGRNGKIGGKVAKGMRNDTTLIMHISADRSRVDLVSIPRDARVKTPTCKYFDGTTFKGSTGDFNVAFSNGGRHGNPAEAAACAINSVQNLTGLKIDHWAVVDFGGFEDMIDAVGGVPMCVPERTVSKKAELDLDPGPQVLTGKEALGLARMRTAEVGNVSGSDLQRIGRTHQLLRQLSRVILSKNLLTDAGELTQFLKATASSLTMDPGLGSTKYMLGLAFSLRNIDPSAIGFYTVPWKLTDDYLDVIILKSAETMWAELRADEPLTKPGNDSAGKAWDNVIDKSPAPLPTSSDVHEALLNECDS